MPRLARLAFMMKPLFHGVTPTDNSGKVKHFRRHLRLSDMSPIEH
jgi:hypothetical protein